MAALRRNLSLTALGIIVAAFGFSLTTCTSRPIQDESSEAALPLVLSVPDNFHFLQHDPKWADAEMGNSGGTLADYGCTLTSVSMAAANLGLETDPGALNAALSVAGGYTERGWLKWASLEQVTNGELQITVYGSPNGAQIDECLDDGHYPVVKFMLDNRVQHWALVVGKAEVDWIVRDPLGPSETRVALGDLTSMIESVRCIRPGNWSNSR